MYSSSFWRRGMKHDPWPWRLPIDSAAVSIEAESADGDVRAAGQPIGAAGWRGTAVKALHSSATTARTIDATVALPLLDVVMFNWMEGWKC